MHYESMPVTAMLRQAPCFPRKTRINFFCCVRTTPNSITMMDIPKWVKDFWENA